MPASLFKMTFSYILTVFKRFRQSPLSRKAGKAFIPAMLFVNYMVKLIR